MLDSRTLLVGGTIRLTVPTYVDDVATTPSSITVTAYKNGIATGDSITPTLDHYDTGLSLVSYTPSGLAAGDTVTLKIAATVSGTTRVTVAEFSVVSTAAAIAALVAAGTVAGVSGDVTGKVLGGGSGTISGVGARVVDGDGDAVAKASAVAALGSGTGARSVTITINDGATALQGVIVRVSQGAESYVETTNASGVAPFSLDDATWTVTATKAGYSMTSQSLVVNGTESVTYSMTAVSVSTPSAPNRSVGTLLCLDTDGTAESGVEVHFRLISGPGTAGYSLDASQWTGTSDANGEIEAEFIVGATYGAKRGDVGREVTFTVGSGASFSLPEHLGSP